MVKLLLLLLCTVYPDAVIPEDADEEFLYRINYYLEHPVDINTAGMNELLDVPFMSMEIAREIIKLRREEPFTSVDQLLLIDEVTPLMFIRLKPFFRVRRKKGPPPSGYTYLVKGIYPFPDTAYDWSPEKLYLRVNLRKNIDAGIVIEKDYYERNYFDYFSGYVSFRGLLFGNFDISEGLGLVFGRPGYFYRPAGFPETRRGILPHLSTFESGYFSGIVFQNYFFTPFVSYSYLDATLNDSTFNHYTSGYHRTGTEMDKKNAVRETFVGAILRYSGFTLAGGIPVYTPVGPTTSSYLPIVSISLSRQIGGYTGIMEIGYSNGYTGGILIKTPIGLQVLYRYFADDFKGLRTSPLAPEEGLYLYMERKVLEVKASGFIDFVRSDSGEYVFEGNIMGVWPVLKGTRLIIRWDGSRTRSGLRGEIVFRRRNKFIKLRLQGVSSGNERGYGGYITAGVRGDLSVEFRYCIFTTPSFNSAIYFYENNLPGEYSIIPLYGDGYRFYMLLREKNTGVYLRTGVTLRDGIQAKIGIAISK
ncbi:hypothetical protein DRQ23_02135 [bacterium]|nr:MAG: hypothetical protein DRQ23_02135 [bacterium]